MAGVLRRRSASFGGFAATKWPPPGSSRRAADDERLDLTRAPTRRQLEEVYLQDELKLGGQARKEASDAIRELRVHFPNFDATHYMTLETLFTRKSPLGAFFESGFRLNFRNIPSDSEHLWVLLRGLLALGMLRMIRTAGRARGQLVLTNPSLLSTVSSKWGNVQDLSIFELLGRLEAALNSDDDILIEETTIILRYLKPRTFSGRKGTLNKRQGSIPHHLKSKSSIIDPFTKLRLDGAQYSARNLCLPIAAVIGVKLADAKAGGMPVSPQVQKWIYSRVEKLAAAKQLVVLADLQPREGPFTINDLNNICAHFGEEYRWLVFDNTGPPRYKFGLEEAPKLVCLFIYEQHFWVISNLARFFCCTSRTKAELCMKCFSATDNIVSHKCPQSPCLRCRNPDCQGAGEEEIYERCFTCKKSFTATQCYEAHLSLGKCSRFTRCCKCNASLNVKDDAPQAQKDAAFTRHTKRCGKIYCISCKGHQDFDHECFMQKLKLGKKTQVMARWYVDIESRVKRTIHHPNLLIAERAPFTEEEKVQEERDKFACAQRLEYFGKHCIRDFVRDLIAPCSPFASSYLIFHNLAGYDGHFIVAEFLRQFIEFSPLYKANRILSMKLDQNNIHFRDSLLFWPGTPLSSLPEMYGIEGEAKGTFPHLLNTRRWIKRDVFFEDGERFPPQRYFEPKLMSKSARSKFLVWWQNEKERFDASPHLSYSIVSALKMYCRGDCRILKKAFERFLSSLRERFPEIEDPLESITLPSLCSRIFRSYFMIEDSIQITPAQGYKQSTSRIALAWISWEQKRLGLTNLRTARHKGELKIFGRFVDAFGRDAEGVGHILEFFGCRWHSCPCGASQSTPVLQSRYAQTLERIEELKSILDDDSSPYGRLCLSTVWECELKASMREDRTLKAFIFSYQKAIGGAPLNPRDGMRGGCTLAVKHDVVADIAHGERILTHDFVSMYPAVNACLQDDEEYPFGPVSVYIGLEIKEKFPKLEEALISREAFGLIHCQVLPPARLFHPVLPALINDKLTFCLCRICAEEQNKGTCRHSDMDRMLTSTWTTLEVAAALKYGYSLGKTFELWHYEQRTKKLLRPYIMNMYLEKEYASGFPPSLATEAEKQTYADKVAKLLGLPVDVTKFKANPGKRQLSKISLNNFWGFFGKRGDFSEKKFLDDFEDLVKMDENPNVEIVSAEIVGDHILAVSEPLEERACGKTSVVIAAFTTSMGRLRLHKLLSQFSQEAIYMDTDSLYFRLRKGQLGPKTGTTLGDLMDDLEKEFPGQGAFIVKFITCGSKSYAYIVLNRDNEIIKSVVKMKGVRFSFEVSEILTPEAIAKLVQGGVINVPQMRFSKDILRQQVTTTMGVKRCAMTSDKRVIRQDTHDLDSIPYGYVHTWRE